eukprot:6200144-Pleurochrysis_carterae.AAC.5
MQDAKHARREASARDGYGGAIVHFDEAGEAAQLLWEEKARQKHSSVACTPAHLPDASPRPHNSCRALVSRHAQGLVQTESPALRTEEQHEIRQAVDATLAACRRKVFATNASHAGLTVIMQSTM